MTSQTDLLSPERAPSPSSLLKIPVMPERTAFAVDQSTTEPDEGDMYAIGADEDDDDMMNEVDAFLEAHDNKGVTEAEDKEAKGGSSLPPEASV